ncbi:MAG: Gfo/Idh/MocA family oxidoreductase [Planctomycetota bacterium]
MPHPQPKDLTRRKLLQNTGSLAAASFLATSGLASVPHVGHDSTIQVALVGCGGRGSGAALNALSIKRGPIQLVAMADVFENRMQSSYEALHASAADRMDVPEERRFIGFDAYRHAMDGLNPGDVVILATPPAFRWVHFRYAIEKGLNVFMEKPVTVDGPTSRRMLVLSELASAKKLKVGVGLMARHSRAFQELAQRIQDGEVGDIITQHGYRMQEPVASFRSLPRPEGKNELHYQIERFHSFLWASGGAYNDFFIHIIDQLCWMKGEWPLKAHALGGRHHRLGPDGVPYIDQNFDAYSVEYTYADGTKMLFEGRNMSGCQTKYSSFLHGTKGSAVVSSSGDYGLPSSLHKGYGLDRASMTWRSKVPDDLQNPYQNEWDDLIDAIRDNVPYNEVTRGVFASLVCNMGRMAAHTGTEITLEDMLACEHEFAPGVGEMTDDSEAPVQADAEGRYPVPQPGLVTDREY